MRALLILLVVLAACSSATESTATTSVSPVESCQAPPETEMRADSDLTMSVDPNPASARETVSLTVSSAGLPQDTLGGVDARWQCWDGSQWATTHAVYRGFGDNPGQTIPLNSEFQIRVPSIGLDLDQGFPIVIPQVDPGLYRIQDEVIVEDRQISGFVLVEVAG